MFRIKRLKRPPQERMPDGTLSPQMPAAVAYAASAAPEGNVTGWTKDVAKAGAFTAEMMADIRAHYANRANTGTLEIEGVDASVAVPPTGHEAEMSKAKAAMASASARIGELETLLATRANAEEQLAASVRRNGELAARVAELEQRLAPTEEPKDAPAPAPAKKK
jgi:hypothetical protein